MNIRRHFGKCLLNVGCVLCRYFEEWYVVLFCKLETFFIRDLSFLFEIALVADEQLVDILGSESFDLLHPLANVVEALLGSDIVDNDDAVCSSVVARCESSESLLTGSVPLKVSDLTRRYLQFAS